MDSGRSSEPGLVEAGGKITAGTGQGASRYTTRGMSLSSNLVWIKATRSVPGGACVELANTGDRIALRDSKHPDVAPFHFTYEEMAAFIDGAKRGEFDRMVAHD